MRNLDHIRTAIAEGKIKDALTEVLKYLESSDRKTRKLRDGVIILQSKFQDVSRRETLGLVDTEDLLREKAQINDALLNLIGDLESGETPVPEEKKGAVPQHRWLLLLLLIPLGLVVVFWGKITGTGNAQGSSDGAQPEKRVELAVERWTCNPDPVVKDQLATIHFEVKNAGTIDANNIEVEWWANIREPKPARAWTIDLPKAGENKAFDFNHTWSGVAENAVTSRIRIDPNRRITSDDPLNNILEMAVAFQTPEITPEHGNCDISVVGYHWKPDPVIAGQPTELVIEIKNDGPDPALHFMVEWWLPYKEKPENTWMCRGLEVGERSAFTFRYTFSGTGSISTQIRLDPANKLWDKNRKNNVLTKLIYIQ